MTALVLLAALVIDAGIAFLLGYIGTPWWAALCILTAAVIAVVLATVLVGRSRAERVRDRTKVAP